MDELKGLKALVTGGASGIGLAIDATFAAEGAVVIVLDLVSERPDVLPAEIGYVTASITDDTAVRTAVDAALETLGGLDILVNNAGIGAQGDGRGCPGRGMAPRARRERRRNRAGLPRCLASTASLDPRRGRQHLLDRGDRWPASAGGLLGQQGCGGRADPRDGGRRHAGRHPGQCRQPGYRRYAVGVASPRAGSTTGAEIAVDGGMAGLRLRPRT
jgi:hypothetical protein